MERIKEDRPITIKDDKGNLNRCIADIVSVCAYFFYTCNIRTTARTIMKMVQSFFFIIIIIKNDLCVHAMQ